MKKLFLIILLFVVRFQAQGQNSLRADSIRIVGYNHNFERCYAVGRLGFIERYLENKGTEDDTFTNDVDITLRNQSDIDNIISSIDNLQVLDTLTFSSKEVVMKAVYSKMGEETMHWIEEADLDIRLALVLYQDDEVDFIWMNRTILDIGYYRCRVPGKLREILSLYTRIFD